MKWFERLKELVKVNVEIHDSFNIKIKKNNTSDKVEYIEKEKSLYINIKEFSYEEKKEIKQLLKSGIAGDEIAILDQDSESTVEDIIIEENNPESRNILKFFKNKIPVDDFGALRASLYVRKCFEGHTHFNTINKLKGDIHKRYGRRGLNISNLCSSNYFETMLVPLFEEMEKYDDFTHDEFLEKYNIIIEEEAFAVFVSNGMSKTEVQKTVEEKIKKNLRYGIDSVTIHGIGKSNLKKIRYVLPLIEDNYHIQRKKINEERNIISAKLWIVNC